MQGQQAAAGFYPAENGRRRYWDGNEWTSLYADALTQPVDSMTYDPMPPTVATQVNGMSAPEPTKVTVPTKPRRWVWPVVAAAALIFGVIIGSAGKGGAAAAPTSSSAAPTLVTVTATVAGTGASPVTVTAPAVTVTAPPVTVTEAAAAVAAAPGSKATSFGDGTWVVGEDIQAGTYKVTAAVSDMCYWGIYKSGTNGGDIVENDIVTGGFPQVTLKAGQDFKSSDCGTWAKK